VTRCGKAPEKADTAMEASMVTRILTAALLMAALAAPARAAQTENLQLFRDVQKQVLRYAWFSIFDNVETQVNDGVVILHGKVTMPYKRSDIEKRVARVDGVRQVVNKIDVLPVSQFDDQLRRQLARAIYANPAFRPFASMVNPPIHIIVERGRVTLEGVVNNNVDRQIANSIASQVLAFEVRNELKTTAEAAAELEKL
jgi:hyperosmotically inducible protein